jgi:NDP-sugar pyrophosphorylase family protein
MPELRPTALVLVGGLGTRLRAVLADRPKPLAEVAGRPFVCRILDQLAAAGFREAVLCTGHLGDRVEAALGSTHGSLRLRYSHEDSPLGTGGALRNAEPLVAGEAVLAMNGDSYFGLPLDAYLEWHAGLGLCASLAVRRVEDASPYGLVELDAAGRVTGFREKVAGAGPGWINTGIYLFSRAALRDIPAGRPVSLEREVLPGWIGTLGAFRSEGPFLDIGTPETLAKAASFFAGPAE